MTVRHTYLVKTPNETHYRICRYCNNKKQLREFKVNKRCFMQRTHKCKSCILKDEKKMRLKKKEAQ